MIKVDDLEDPLAKYVAKIAVLEERLKERAEAQNQKMKVRGAEITRLTSLASSAKREMDRAIAREESLSKSIENQRISIARLEAMLDTEKRKSDALRSLIDEKNDYINKISAMLGRAEAKVDLLRKALEIKSKERVDS